MEAKSTCKHLWCSVDRASRRSMSVFTRALSHQIRLYRCPESKVRSSSRFRWKDTALKFFEISTGINYGKQMMCKQTKQPGYGPIGTRPPSVEREHGARWISVNASADQFHRLGVFLELWTVCLPKNGRLLQLIPTLLGLKKNNNVMLEPSQAHPFHTRFASFPIKFMLGAISKNSFSCANKVCWKNILHSFYPQFLQRAAA